jgi:hypothetical protein
LTSVGSGKVGVAGPSLAGESTAPRIEVVEKAVSSAPVAAKKAVKKKTK